MNNDCNWNLLKSILIVGALFVACLYLFIIIPLVLIYAFIKLNLKKWLFYAGLIISIVGVIVFFDEVNSYLKYKVLEFLFDSFNPQGAGIKWNILEISKKLIVIEFKLLPYVLMLSGLFSLYYSYLFLDGTIEPEVINSSVKELKMKLDDIRKYHGLFAKKKEDFKLYLGNSIYTNKEFILKQKERIGHQLTVGATRSGKTSRVLMPSIISDFLKGSGVVFCDPKGDMENLSNVFKIIKSNGKADKFKVFCIDNPQISWPYNPLLNGNITQKVGRLMKAFNWENEFYKTQSEMRLGMYLKKLSNNEIVPTLDKIYKLFETENHENTAGMISNLSRIVNSDFAPMVSYDDSGIDFLKAQQEGEFIYILVNTSSYLEASHSLIRFMLLDMMWCSNKIQGDLKYKPKFFSVVIDEFGDFIVPGFQSFIKQCASAGYCLNLACQSFGDLASQGLSDFIISNTYNHLVLRQSFPENADLAAKMFGTRVTQKSTERYSEDSKTGEKSVRQAHELRVDPNFIKTLKEGRGIFCNRSSLRYLELPLTECFSLENEPSYITDKDRKTIPYEIFVRAADARRNLKYDNDFSPNKYLIKTSDSEIKEVKEPKTDKNKSTNENLSGEFSCPTQ